MDVDTGRLHDLIRRSFDDEELKTLCMYLGVDYTDLPALTHQGRVRELILLCDRRSKTQCLIDQLHALRPERAHDWDACQNALPLHVTIHTGILVSAFTEESGAESDLLLHLTELGARICIDQREEAGEKRSEIERHYRAHVPREVLNYWIRELTHRSQLECIPCNGLPALHAIALTKIACHDPANEVFIAVADLMGKTLIADDDSFGNGPVAKVKPRPDHIAMLDYLTHTMHLSVYDAVAASSSL